MRSDGLWKGRSGGTGYAARDMARQVKWADPALRREREREREKERREREKLRCIRAFCFFFTKTHHNQKNVDLQKVDNIFGWI